LQVNRAGRVTVDNISADNLALYFLGNKSAVTQSALTAQNSVLTAKRDRYYQIGVSESNPSGVRDISNLIVKKGSPGFATTVAASGNYSFDSKSGRIYIEKNATDIPDNTVIQVTYDAAANTREQIISNTQAIYGAMRFLADNPTGANRDYFFPYVKLAPDGDYALKGEEWQTIGFTFDILLKGSLQASYIDGRATAV
jgi:hypothetical protein